MNKHIRISLTLTTILTLLFVYADGRASTLRVPEDYESIASALAAASSGDVVDIAAGTYYEHDLIWPPGVSILGRGDSPESVIIDAQEQGRVMEGEELTSDNVLAYVTLYRGNASGYRGSGLKVEGDPYIHNVIIEYCINSYRGVGLYMYGAAVIEDCIFRHNQSDAEDSNGGGASLASHAGIPFTVRNIEVYENRASYGSGLYVGFAYGTLENLRVHDNEGIGMLMYHDGFGINGPYVNNSVFYNNTGAGIAFCGSPVISNCTFVGNGTIGNDVHGALLSIATWEDHNNAPIISECVIAYNNGPGIRWHEPTPYTIECNNVFGNKGGNYLALPDFTGVDGNISLDPKFCDMQSEGVYGIQAGSPCAAKNNDCGVLMGAFPVSCEDTATESISWSRIKSLY
ncbi:MAG: right-handed parallel beta-helix repeat-containing protein [bacterium]|nr:right-handed parallel beta-helix repeat-containing protein [bacterium]